jgi:uncharacterized protein
MIFLLAISSQSVQAASFDCSKATHQEEKTVCNTPKLSQLDDQMAILYFEARKKTTDLNAFERSRTNWILQKRTCESDVVCLERSYLQRIAVLEQISPMTSSSNSASASSTSTGQGSQLSQLNGEWYSNQWKYGYTLTNGVGVATSTNSPNFKVGDRIIFLQQSSEKTFEGTQVYTDGKFYKITVLQQSNDTLLFKGEKNVSWTMTKKTQTSAQATTSTTLATPSPITPLAPTNSLPTRQSNLPPCQGTNPATWNLCFGKDTAPDPVMPTITRTYVGEYKDGKPHGTGTETFPNGAKYVGGFIGGKRIGQGTATYPDGSKYVGEWRNGSRNGQGTHTFSNGEKYVGEIKDGNRHGQGTLTLTSGATETGTWREGRLLSMAELAPVNSASTASPSTTNVLQVTSNTTSTTAQTLPPSTTSSIAEQIANRKLPPCQGERSGWDMCVGQFSFNDNSWSGEFMRGGSGQWAKGELHRGTRTESDGFSYVGNHNGQSGLDGPFMVSFNNGRPQPAIWKNNNLVSIPTNLPKCQGNEVSNWNMCLGVEKVTKQFSITEYVGEFKDGKYDGYGVLLMSARTFYLGQFKDGKFHGYGIYTNRADSRSYDGEWINGKRNGQGSYIGQFGREYIGQWRDDKRNGNGTEFRLISRGKPMSKTYVGAWQDDKKNGQGTYTHLDDGSTGTGEWFKGEFVIATRENISKFNDDVVAQALSYVSGFVLDDIDKSTRRFFISNNAETNRPCTYELVVDPTSNYKEPRVQIDLNKGNPSAIQFFTQGDVYISRVEGLPEFRCNGCNGARVQRAWA